MSKRLILTVGIPACAGLCAVLAGTLSAQNPPPGQAQQPGTNPPPAMSGGQNEDQEFLINEYRGNLCAIEASKIVASRADMPDVKQFAQSMVDAHTQANAKIKDLAGRKNIQLPSQLEDWERGMIDALGRKQGPELGRSYVFRTVGMHHTCLLAKRYEAAHGTDNDIKQFAQQGENDVERHMRHAERLADQIIGTQGKMRPVSERRDIGG